MPKISFPKSTASGYTFISNEFITNYMVDANGTFVKVYLYTLYAHTQQKLNLSTENIAETLHLLESDVVHSFKYWQNQGLLELTENENELTIEFLPCVPKPDPTTLIQPKNERAPAKNSVQTIKLESRPEYSPEELAIYQQQPEIHQLFIIAQQYLGRMLSPSDLSIIYSFYDWLRLSPEIIELLIEYCVSNNHRSLRYIEKVALSWAEEGIETAEQAKERLKVFNKEYRTIMKEFGIARREPTPVEIQFMKKWLKSYGFDLKIIAEACKKTMLATNNPSFQYADRILTDWHEHKVKNLKDVEMLDKAFAQKKAISDQNKLAKKDDYHKTPSKFVNYKQRDWDFDELEKLEREYLKKDLS